MEGEMKENGRRKLRYLCIVTFLLLISTCKTQWVGLLFIGEGALENKQEDRMRKGKKKGMS